WTSGHSTIPVILAIVRNNIITVASNSNTPYSPGFPPFSLITTVVMNLNVGDTIDARLMPEDTNGYTILALGMSIQQLPNAQALMTGATGSIGPTGLAGLATNTGATG